MAQNGQHGGKKVGILSIRIEALKTSKHMLSGDAEVSVQELRACHGDEEQVRQLIRRSIEPKVLMIARKLASTTPES